MRASRPALLHKLAAGGWTGGQAPAGWQASIVITMYTQYCVGSKVVRRHGLAGAFWRRALSVMMLHGPAVLQCCSAAVLAVQ